MNLIIGNVVALCASILMVYSGALNDRKKVILLQTVYTTMFIISDCLLDGFSGAIINFLNIIRNMLAYYDKLDTKSKIIITIASIIACRLFSHLGIYGMLPVVSMIIYILFMNTKDIQKFKLLIISTAFLWGIYDLKIQLYTSFVFDIATILAALVTLMINDAKRRKEDGKRTI